MLSFRRFLIESYRHSLLLEDKRTEFVNRYMKHHKEHPLVQQDPEKARELIGHSLQFGQNPEEHKFITGQLLSGTYKPGEDDPTIQATLGNWRKLTKETRGVHNGKTLADHDHDSVSTLFRASSGEIKSSKAKQSAGDLAKYHIGAIDGGEHGPLDVYHIHQDMVPKGEEKAYTDFSKAVKRVCPPGSTICVQHSGDYVKDYSGGHGFFLYTNKDGQTVYGHGNNDRGIVRHDNSVVEGQAAQSVKNQTANLLSGKIKAAYSLRAGNQDGINPDVKLTDDEFHSALANDDFDVVTSARLSSQFTYDRFERAFRDPNPTVRSTAVESTHFGPQHIDRALSDPSHFVAAAAVKSKHFRPEHVEKAMTFDDRKDPLGLVRFTLIKTPHFTKEHFEKLFRDPNPAIRAATVLSKHFGKEHVEEAFSDPSELVREAVVHSRHFGHQHLGRALNDRHKHVRRAAERKFHNALI